MPPIDLLKVNLGGPQYTQEYDALITGKSWNLKEPNQNVLDMYSTQIKALEGTIIRLRRKSNAKLAIFRIPSEILSEIFLYCLSSGLTQNSLYKPRTFNFIHVCWYWKLVAYETPHLWSTWPGGCVDAWPILHARSKNTPLDIHLRKRPVDPTALVLILSNPETHRRLRSLDFKGHHSWFEQFLEYFVTHNHENVPNLETLRIDISSIGTLSGPEKFERVNRFFSLSFPKLHTLEIINLRINWHSSFPSLSSITQLTIKNPPKMFPPKMTQLLSLLRRNPRMNKLVLQDGALPPPDDTGGERDFLALPDLRNLQLSGGLLPTMRLLEHLRLPPGLPYADIAVDATEYSNEAILPYIQPFLRSYYLSEDREERRIDGLRFSLGDLRTAELTITTTPKALQSEVTPSQIPLLPMNLHIETHQDKRPLSMELSRLLPVDNLRDLSLESLEFTVEQCKVLFSRVRRVEELCVSASSGPGAIAALELPNPPGKGKQPGKDKGKATETPANSKRQKGKNRSGKGGGQGYGANGKQATPSTPQEGHHTITADSVPLPRLKILLLSEIVFGPGYGKKYKGVSENRLVNLVRNRKNAGYGLQELGIQTCVGFGAKQVRECEKSVRNVVWDGDEGESSAHGCRHHHFWDPADFSPSEEYDAHYQIYGRPPWAAYDSDGFDDFLPYF